MGFSGSAFVFFIRRTDIDFFVRMFWYFNVLSGRVALIDIFCVLRFWNLVIWSFRVWVALGGFQLGPRRSQEVRGSPELQNGGLRALEEAWDDFFNDGRVLDA